VDLLPENEEAGAVFMMVRGQVVSAEIGKGRCIVTLSIPAVRDVMDIYGVKDQQRCLGRVMRLWHEMRSKDES
jgi:hypothetical protein